MIQQDIKMLPCSLFNLRDYYLAIAYMCVVEVVTIHMSVCSRLSAIYMSVCSRLSAHAYIYAMVTVNDWM